MITGHVMMAITLDGFVARKDHSIDWLIKQNTSGEDYGYDGFEAGIDVIVMGSGSFRTVLGFGEWPYKKPVVVLTSSMTTADIPANLQGKVELSNLPPTEIMALLENRGCKRVYVDGGAVVQSFLRDGLVLDMRITLVPILIGDGIRLFGNIAADIDLKLMHAKPYPSGLVSTLYEVIC
ncbi:MAG: dihydrofolate reductase family protein [Kordiimonadaceae bacterium]|nr:dihydrofolate reductase family protein [Kordiimonadaceae bacterium]MBO6568907.1 dihydrofolate reductase family protein [Kordiimonadaceae bacterium]MBO6965118.1 dihydrofolate reductase family protein [Kordiimonadaceae bacterium]